MDPQVKKTALRMLTYGLYVLGVEHEGQMGSATVTWVTQASFEPPLLVVGVKRDGWPYTLLRQSRRFALSILERGQHELARAFFRSPRPEGGRLAGYAYRTALTGAPILEDSLSFLEGEVLSFDETGDHAVVIARVTNAGVLREGSPLALSEMGLSYGG